MSIMKYTTKYLTYGLLTVIVIFGLGWFIQNSKSEHPANSPYFGLNGVEIIGKQNGVPDPMSVLLDKKGNPLPLSTESEYEAEDLRRLVGDRDPEEAAQFLAQHGYYHPTLLSLLDDESAFDYL